MTRLTGQQDTFLRELAQYQYVHPVHFEGWQKPRGINPRWPEITKNSASAALRRLVARGLAEKTGTVYRITDAGRRAIAERDQL